MDPHSSSANTRNPSSFRYNRNLDFTSQDWDTPILSFTQPETSSTNFIASFEPPSNLPSTFTVEVASMADEKSEI